MIVISFETRQDREAILDKAARYFGDVGLKLTEKRDCCAMFESEMGYVKVTLNQKGKKFEVDVESREYDYQAEKFADQFK